MNHYKEQAHEHGLAATSTMDDEITREKELQLIRECALSFGGRVLDVGCGNGYTINKLSEAGNFVKNYPDKMFVGVDTAREMIDLCLSRHLPDTTFIQGDVTQMGFPPNSFDFAYSERCLINLKNWDEQFLAIQKIHYVLKPHGKFLLIECFTDGQENLNRARKECGLPVLKAKSWNHYLDKDVFVESASALFKPLPCQTNFLSTHYFIARVLHALVTKNGQRKNTEFVKFFNYLPPMGNYSPLQAYLLEKICKISKPRK